MRKNISNDLANKINEMYIGGMNINQIRLDLKMGYKRVKNILQKNGLIDFEDRYRGYTYDECMNIGELYVADKWDEIIKSYPGISRDNIYDICSHFGIPKDTYFWSDEDIAILINNYGKIPRSEISKLMNGRHSPISIGLKALKLNIGSKPFWDVAEDEILKNNYSSIPIDQIMELIPARSYDSIIHRAKYLGLTSYRIINEKYSSEQKQFIIDHWREMSDEDIASQIGKTARGVMEQRNDMGLYRICKDYSKYENMSKFFRGHLQDWKIKSMESCEFKCIFTGSKDFAIHHIYGFNIIMSEVFATVEKKIQLKSFYPSDYSKEELDYMLKIFNDIHSKYPLGVCVRKDIHDLFHSIYGSGGNNEKQWNKFCCDLNSGLLDIKL